VADLERQLADANNQLAIAQGQHGQDQQVIANLTAKQADLLNQIRTLTSDLQNANGRITSLTHQLSDANSTIANDKNTLLICNTP
jgi:chromosome segregation ATPase